MRVIGLILLVFSLIGCSNEKIIITSEFIVNPNWGEQANAIQINGIRVKNDSTIDPFAELTQVDILNKLEPDSSFSWFANAKIKSGESYKNKKIFWNRDNGFPWWNRIAEAHAPVLGKLKKDHWYKLSHLLTHSYDIYIYVDSTNKIHRFDVEFSNY